MRWAKTDEFYLKQNWGQYSLLDMSTHLNRTKCSVYNKGRSLGLKKPQEKKLGNLPFSNSLAYILGVLCGDGSIFKGQVRLGVKDDDFADEFYKHCINVLRPTNINVTRFTSNQIFYVSISSLSFIRFLNEVGQFNTKDWEVPLIIHESNDTNLVRMFLRGLFDSEGNFHKYQIRMTSISKSLYDICGLLNKLNIQCSVHKEVRKTIIGNQVYTLSIFKEKNINLFRKRIGFSINRKQNKLISYLRKVNVSRYKTKMLKKNRKKLRQLYELGNTLQYIAKKFGIKSLNSISNHIKR